MLSRNSSRARINQYDRLRFKHGLHCLHGTVRSICNGTAVFEVTATYRPSWFCEGLASTNRVTGFEQVPATSQRTRDRLLRLPPSLRLLLKRASTVSLSGPCIVPPGGVTCAIEYQVPADPAEIFLYCTNVGAHAWRAQQRGVRLPPVVATILLVKAKQKWTPFAGSYPSAVWQSED